MVERPTLAEATKIICDVLPDEVLIEFALALKIGIVKHDHWSSSKPEEYYWGCIRRHLSAHINGEMRCPKDGQRHLAAVLVRDCQLMDKDIRREQCQETSSSSQTM